MDAETLVLTANTETVYGDGLPRPEGRRPDRRRSAAEDARRGDGHVAALPRGHRPARAGQGQGRQVPVPAAGVQGRGAGGLLRRQVADLQRQLLPARLQGGRQDRPGRGAHEADQGLPAGEGGRIRRRWSSSTAPASRSTRSTPTPSRSSRCWPSSSTKSRPRSSRRSNASTCRRSASRRASRSTPTRRPRRCSRKPRGPPPRWRGPTASRRATPTRTTTRTASGSTSATCRTPS